MMQAIILKCTPQSRFHFGRVGIDADTSLNDTSITPHSDTLFSAMIHLGVQLSDKEADIEQFVGCFGNNGAEPKIKISSGYYCLENAKGDFLYFLPKPLHFNLPEKEQDNKDLKKIQHKDLKKIQFISKSVWELGFSPKDWNTHCKIIGKRFVVTTQEFTDFSLEETDIFFKEIALPKVFVHKEDKKDAFFYQTTLQIMPLNHGTKVHFYFLMECQKLSESENNLLNQVLNLIAYEGIGGERSTGCGLFQGVAYQDFDLKVPNSNALITISLTNPNNQTEFEAFQNYQIVTRGGRQIGHSNHLFLKKVNMIAEGAWVRERVRGRIVSIAPHNIPQPYLRNGICMTLPFYNSWKF